MATDAKIINFEKDHSEMPFRIERLSKNSGYANRKPHRHGYFEIFLFESGGGKHIIDFVETNISDRSLHFIAPGQVHQLLREGNSEGFVVIFTDEFLYLDAAKDFSPAELSFFQQHVSDQVIDIAADVYPGILKIFQDLNSTYDSSHPYRNQILQSYLRILLYSCKSMTESRNVESLPDEGSSVRIMTAFRKLIDKHYTTNHQVNDYADMLNITPAYLNLICRKTAGIQAGEMIRNRLVLESKRMLLFADNSAKEIAYSLNFKDPSHFGKFFKKYTGYTPQQFIAESKSA